jgi:hypothetical protein
MFGSVVTLGGVPTMRVSIGTPSALPSDPVMPSWMATVALLLGFTRRIRLFFASIGSRTTLVRAPFSTEQNRD